MSGRAGRAGRNDVSGPSEAGEGAGKDREAVRVALALGSNLGDREGHLVEAVRRLPSAIRLEDASSIYESDPVGIEDQPRFLNAVVVVRTDLGPSALLRAAHAMEERAGRRRTTGTVAGGPRTLDVDILLYGRKTVTRSGLRIPPPRWKERSFVLAPLAEVVPGWVDPETGRTVLDLWTERGDDLPPVHVVRPPGTLRGSGR